MYIATFYTHFGAMFFERQLEKLGDRQGQVMPVPRALSASCGVCVRFSLPFDQNLMASEDLESVFLEKEGGGYGLLFENE